LTDAFVIFASMNRDNDNELFPIVDEQGNVLGRILRGQAHDGRKVLHPVVHLHLFNSKGELYLQRRPDWKPIQPGKWDTAVGGHISYGETVQQAFRREVMEELGINVPDATPMGHYVFESKVEKELVYVFRAIYDGPVNPSADELDGGRFWTRQQIMDAMGRNILTPNFESEYLRFFSPQSSRSEGVV
jgi:isopentenyldiphosphate isomerase